MKTEKQKMISGELYDPLDPELSSDRIRTRMLIKALNETGEDQPTARREILSQLVPGAATDLWIQPPFYCDYGYNITTGEKVFLNFNCIILDVAPVSIGARTMIATGVQLLTATHPIDHQERASGRELAEPISIGEDVWIGGGVIVCPGVSIGDRSVIGAGSVVTKDIPADVVAVGNPCRVLRELRK